MDKEFKESLIDANFNDILGQEDVKEQIKSALLMERHIILVGPPGIGKTTLAKNIAKILPEITVNDCSYHCDPKKPICHKCLSEKKVGKIKIKGEERFVRIQGSPDLTAEDLIGDIDPIKAMKYGALDIKSFTPGKIFKANNKVLFFDELNRCSEKLQNALLQVLEEKKATISSYNVDIDADFIFIGTMNPDDSSTEPLSDVFLDRFDLIYMHYPESAETEKKIVLKKGKSLLKFPDKLLELMVELVRDLRSHKDLEKKPSVRATLGLYERAQAHAYLKKKKQVDFSDIEKSIVSVLSHRIRLKPSVKYMKKTGDLIKEELKRFKTENNITLTEEGDVP